MNNNEAWRLSAIISGFMNRKGLSRQDFADACGLSDSAIRNYIDCQDPKTWEPVDPKLGSLEKMAKVMNMDIVELVCKIKKKPYHSAPVAEEPVPVIKETEDDDPPDYLKRVSSHSVPYTHRIPNSGSIYDIFTYRQGFGRGFPVEERYYKPDKTIVYKVTHVPFSPIINENDNVIIWLDEEYRDGDIICVRQKIKDPLVFVTGTYEDMLHFYKMGIQNNSGFVLYGDQNFKPIYVDAESDFKADIIGKVIAVIRNV